MAKTEVAGKILTFPKFTLETVATIPPDKLGVPEQAILRRTGDDSSRCAALYNGKQIVVTRQSEDLSGDKTETRIVLDQDIPGPVTAITLDRSGTMLYAGTASGSILWWRLSDEQVVDHDIVPPSLEKHAITSLELMLGDVTLVAGDAGGGVTNWFFVTPASESPKKPASGKRSMVKEVKKLTYIRSLAPHRAAIREIVPSPRNRALLVRDEASVATMDYTTSQRQLLTLRDIAKIAFTSRGDVVAGLVGGRLKGWRIEGSLFGLTSNLHPEVSWSSLWGRVWYEGLNEPEFSWQPHGDEEYESKLSLVPLVFGTLKGTFYAMLLAAPLALGGGGLREPLHHAAGPGLDQAGHRNDGRRALGGAGIPRRPVAGAAVERLAVGVLLEPGCRAAGVRDLPADLAMGPTIADGRESRPRPRVPHHVAVAGRGAGHGGPLLRAAGAATSSAATSCAGWPARLGVVYVQRNSILIAFGVGFMVIPMIFTLAEDALSSVPHSMTAASMALGASRWQTLWRVVLPSASPGIFAAVMIGFGRAVGETMVFLMATGNTPLIDLSPFNGMRTLSANIAEEIPGAPLNGTLYRTLFLCAVILFIMTFFLNTIAEVVRQRLRKRFGQF